MYYTSMPLQRRVNHAKLKFYECIYKLNITFAAQNKTDNEGNLDHIIIDSIERIHDVRMVRPPQAPGNEDLLKLAAHPDHPLLMGSSILRILRPGTGKQDRIRGQRRSIQPHAA